MVTLLGCFVVVVWSHVTYLFIKSSNQTSLVGFGTLLLFISWQIARWLVQGFPAVSWGLSGLQCAIKHADGAQRYVSAQPQFILRSVLRSVTSLRGNENLRKNPLQSEAASRWRHLGQSGQEVHQMNLQNKDFRRLDKMTFNIQSLNIL